MIVLNGNEIVIDEKKMERIVERVFFKSIDLLGGIKKLAEYRTLTWLPSLSRAAFAIVLREEYLKTEDEIAAYIGLTKVTVRNILRADSNAAMYKISHMDELEDSEKKELKIHIAGGVAKLAYKLVKDGQDAQTILDFCHQMASESIKAVDCESPWAYLVLKHTKGIGYPIMNAEILLNRLKDIKIKGVNGEEVAKGLFYPIKTPAKLLHEIKEYLDMKNGV